MELITGLISNAVTMHKSVLHPALVSEKHINMNRVSIHLWMLVKAKSTLILQSNT